MLVCCRRFRASHSPYATAHRDDEDTASSWQEKWHSLTLMWCLILASMKCMAWYLLTSWAILQQQKLAAAVTACELVQETGWGFWGGKLLPSFSIFQIGCFPLPGVATACCHYQSRQWAPFLADWFLSDLWERVSQQYLPALQCSRVWQRTLGNTTGETVTTGWPIPAPTPLSCGKVSLAISFLIIKKT